MARKPRSSRPRRGQEKKKQTIIGLSMLGVVILVFAWGGYTFISSSSNNVERDEETMCPVEGPNSVTVVLIDFSSSFNNVQKEAIKREIRAVKEGIPQNGLLEIYTTVDKRDSILVPSFVGCSPGNIGEVESGIATNKKLVKIRWEETFGNKIDSITERMLTVPESEKSPVMESIQSISITALNTREREYLPRRLVVVSDMLQNTSVLNMYTEGIPRNFETFAARPTTQQALTDLKETEVEVLYIRRIKASTIQGPTHIEFWDKLITLERGTLTRVKSIEG
jgi:hypothetical protein